MEMQFLDAASGAVLGECRDNEVVRKYAADMDAGAAGAAKTRASGYASSFQAWSYAKHAFDKWSLLVAQRLSYVRGFSPTQGAGRPLRASHKAGNAAHPFHSGNFLTSYDKEF